MLGEATRQGFCHPDFEGEYVLGNFVEGIERSLLALSHYVLFPLSAFCNSHHFLDRRILGIKKPRQIHVLAFLIVYRLSGLVNGIASWKLTPAPLLQFCRQMNFSWALLSSNKLHWHPASGWMHQNQLLLVLLGCPIKIRSPRVGIGENFDGNFPALNPRIGSPQTATKKKSNPVKRYIKHGEHFWNIYRSMPP